MAYKRSIGVHTFSFDSLAELFARATPLRSGDVLAGVAAHSELERVAAQMVLADLPLREIIAADLIPSETDEVTRLISETHDQVAFERIPATTVGDFRNWLLLDTTTGAVLQDIARGITPELAAAVCKIMRNQDLIAVAAKLRNVTAFRSTIGQAGRLAVRLQPNDPVDNPRGIAAQIVDGLCYGCGDAVIGINPAGDNPTQVAALLHMLDDIRIQYNIPTQSCVLTHVTTTIRAIERGVPVDLVFQSIGGSQAVNDSFGVNINLLREAHDAAGQLRRGTVGNNYMYFETGQGSALSAGAHHGLDQQTVEARAYGLARAFSPLLVNTVVGFIGPEYLYDGKQITRAGLEDHFCGKLLGLPMGVDVCYTNHAEADQDDMDNLLTLLGVAGCNFVMGVAGADDVMLNYQSTSFHDAMYLRSVLGLRPAPEFERWLIDMGLFNSELRPLDGPRRAEKFLEMKSL